MVLMAKSKKNYYDKVQDLLNEYKEKRVDLDQIRLDSRYGDEGCNVCKNSDFEKEYCNVYDCNPYELEEKEGIFVVDYCDKFTDDETKEFTGKKLEM